MKKILVPIDGSSVSQKTAEMAVEIAKKYDSDITFVSIFDARFISTYDIGGVISLPIKNPQISEGLIKLQQAMLDAVTSKIDFTGIAVEKVVLTGVPYEEILKIANDENYDLIVMGRRGFSKIKRFFIGSITQRVISDAPCPVLIINNDEEK